MQALAREVAPRPAARELSMLLASGEQVSIAMLATALGALDVPAISLTGPQAAILTTDTHTDARIVRVMPTRIQQELASGNVVVVAGFQGVSYARQELTTLGRGGSDTTATALGASLGATRCEIYSDVDGVYSADPRIVPDARHLDQLDYETMLEMARLGAKVLNPESLRWAAENELIVHARSSAGLPSYTQIDGVEGADGGVRAVTGYRRLLAVSIDAGEPAERLLEELASDIVACRHATRERLELWCPERVATRLHELREELDPAERLHVAPSGGTVSVVLGQRDRVCAAQTRQAVEAQLAALGITVRETFVTDRSVSCLIDDEEVPRATAALHDQLVGAPEPQPVAVAV